METCNIEIEKNSCTVKLYLFLTFGQIRAIRPASSFKLS